MKTCKDISELLSDSMEHPLTWRERLAVRGHLLMCRHYCSRFQQLQQQVHFLRKAAQRYHTSNNDDNPPTL